MILITGGDGFLGKNIQKALNENNESYLILSRGTNSDPADHNRIFYSMGESLKDLIPDSINVTKIIHLAHDYSQNKINGEDINCVAIRDIVSFCEFNDIPLFYSSSLAAYNQASNYGRVKKQCEEIVSKYKKGVIFRIGMLIGENGGLLHKLNMKFKNTPFFIIPGDATYPIYLTNVLKASRFIVGFKLSNVRLQYLVDQGPIRFIDCLEIKNKFLIKVPIFLIKNLLLPFHILRINLKSFSYDGMVGLSNPPMLDETYQMPTYFLDV